VRPADTNDSAVALAAALFFAGPDPLALALGLELCASRMLPPPRVVRPNARRTCRLARLALAPTPAMLKELAVSQDLH